MTCLPRGTENCPHGHLHMAPQWGRVAAVFKPFVTAVWQTHLELNWVLHCPCCYHYLNYRHCL
jgi:hypothetical protein